MVKQPLDWQVKVMKYGKQQRGENKYVTNSNVVCVNKYIQLTEWRWVPRSQGYMEMMVVKKQ